MNKTFLLTLIKISILACFITGLFNVGYAQDEQGRVLLIREAQQFQNNTVAVEGYLMDNILEVKVTARMMHATKPKIYNALVVGSRLGRLEIESKEILLASVEEEEPYPTSRKDKGFVSFSGGKKNKRARGTLTRELLVFKIPRDKVVKGKRYRLWVQITSLQQGEKYKTFKFDLKDLYEKMSKVQQGNTQ
ncbi:MAG: hypothetical protein KKC66_03630 [Candidatus Omnitrophica bacterium]|nr:hypothetical protein [Candidatus Omnitrophota bacterium]MBU1932974.1 hypothetical protein [Candidatus Omnitrophota bacterium]